MKYDIAEIKDQLRGAGQEYKAQLAANANAMKASAAEIDIPNIQIVKEWNEYMGKIFSKPVNSQRVESEAYYKAGAYSQIKLVVHKQFGERQMYRKTARYYGSSAFWARLRKEHADLIKDPSKRKVFIDMITFRDKVNDLLKDVGERGAEYAVDIPYTYSSCEHIKIGSEGFEIFKSAKEGKVTKLWLTADHSKTGLRFRFELDKGELLHKHWGYSDKMSFATIIVGAGMTLDTDDYTRYTGLEKIFENAQIRSDIEGVTKKFGIVTKTWEYLTDKYSFFLFMNGKF